MNLDPLKDKLDWLCKQEINWQKGTSVRPERFRMDFSFGPPSHVTGDYWSRNFSKTPKDRIEANFVNVVDALIWYINSMAYEGRVATRVSQLEWAENDNNEIIIQCFIGF
jgi:hypothetical protein